MDDRWTPVPVPLGDGRHDIGDDARAAIFHRLHNDFTLAAPWLTAEQRKHLAMLAAASVRALLHELGTLRDLSLGVAQPASNVVAEEIPANPDPPIEASDALRLQPPPDNAVQDGLLHPAHQVYFRAGLIACREYMARFVEAESPTIAMSIRANWWPALGTDYGPPRQLHWDEVTVGEFGSSEFRVKTADEVSPTQEALPVALGFLQLPPASLTATGEDHKT